MFISICVLVKFQLLKNKKKETLIAIVHEPISSGAHIVLKLHGAAAWRIILIENRVYFVLKQNEWIC